MINDLKENKIVIDCISVIKKDEGIKNFPYLDTRGKLTIGVGRNLSDNGLSDDEINDLLDNDLRQVCTSLRSFAFSTFISDIRGIAIINMAFNLGQTKFKGFKKMIAALEQKDYKLAAEEIRDSKYWRDNDTHNRAERIAKMIETDKMDPYYEI